MYKNRKFRESHTLKNGDISWRCLGRICKASIKTDPDMKNIVAINKTHEGPHPVTMSSMMQTRRSLTPSTATEGDSPCNARVTVASGDIFHTSKSTELAAAVVTSILPDIPASTPASSKCQTRELEETPTSEMILNAAAVLATNTGISTPPAPGDYLLSENIRLKKEIVNLKKQLQDILDHSIESDQRLLKYIDEVFAVSKPYTAHEAVSPSSLTFNQGTQTDTPNHDLLADGMGTISKNTAMTLERPCPRCIILQEESTNMLAAIRILEDQLQVERDATTTTTRCPVTSLLSVPVQNRFDVLEESEQELEDNNFTVVNKKKKKTTKLEKIPPVKNLVRKKQPLKVGFKSISISGDSHARHVAGLIKDQLHPRIAVSGMCKPGAGLLSVAPPGVRAVPTDHCHVLMAGTNDVAAGRGDIIYKNMENTIKQLSSTSKLVVCTLPHRYDLAPNSSVNKNIRLINNHIAELCYHHRGVELIDFNIVRRRGFTSHGMHLNMRGKRVLARLIAERIAAFPASVHCHLLSPGGNSDAAAIAMVPSQPSGTLSPATAAPPAELLTVPGPIPAQPMSAPIVTMEHDSYAEALMFTKQSTKNSLFLGKLTQ